MDISFQGEYGLAAGESTSSLKTTVKIAGIDYTVSYTDTAREDVKLALAQYSAISSSQANSIGASIAAAISSEATAVIPYAVYDTTTLPAQLLFASDRTYSMMRENNRCPTCFRNIIDFDLTGTQTWSNDPVRTPKGLNGTFYIGYQHIKRTDITEIQTKRLDQEISAGASASLFQSMTGYRHMTKLHITELRDSTENILTVAGLIKRDYFNYDEQGSSMGTTQTQWYNSVFTSYTGNVRALHIEDLRHPLSQLLTWSERFYQAESPFYVGLNNDGYYNETYEIYYDSGKKIDLLERYYDGTTIDHEDIAGISPMIDEPTQTEKSDSISCYSIADIDSAGTDDAKGDAQNLVEFRRKIWWELTETDLPSTLAGKEAMSIDEGKIVITTGIGVYAGHPFDGNVDATEYNYFKWNAGHFLKPTPQPVVKLTSTKGLAVVCEHLHRGFLDSSSNGLPGSYVRLVVRLTLTDESSSKYYVTYNIYQGDRTSFKSHSYVNEKNINWEDTFLRDDYLIIRADKILSDIGKSESDNIYFCYDFGIEYEVWCDSTNIPANEEVKSRTVKTTAQIKKICFASLNWIYNDRNQYYLQRAAYNSGRLDDLSEEQKGLENLGLTAAEAAAIVGARNTGNYRFLIRSWYNVPDGTYRIVPRTAAPSDGTALPNANPIIQGGVLLPGRLLYWCFQGCPMWSPLDFADRKTGTYAEVVGTVIPSNLLHAGEGEAEMLFGTADSFNPAHADYGNYSTYGTNWFKPDAQGLTWATPGETLSAVGQSLQYKSPYELGPTGPVKVSSTWDAVPEGSRASVIDGVATVTSINQESIRITPTTITYNTVGNAYTISIDRATGVETSILN